MRHEEDRNKDAEADEDKSGEGSENPPAPRTAGNGQCYWIGDCGLNTVAVHSTQADRSKKSITTPSDSFDESRIIGGVTQGIAQAANGGVEAVVKIDEGVGRPEAVPQFFPGDDFAGFFEKL